MSNNKSAIRKKELPLRDDNSNLFLQTIITISVFLFTIALAGVFSINTMLSNWNKSIVGSMTVQILPINNVDKEEATRLTDMEQQKVINLLETMQEVKSATALDEAQLQRLVKPWLGDGVNLENLPMPRLIDVKIKRGAQIDFTKMAEAIAQVSDNASIDSHKLWLAKLIDFADGIKMLAWAILILVIAVSTTAIFYTTQTSMGLHTNIIGILHIMGAKDTYIAQQYARRSAFLGLFGGILGVTCAIPAIFIISMLAQQIEGGIIADAQISFTSWLIIFSIPFVSSAIAMATAYVTVKKTLGKMV